MIAIGLDMSITSFGISNGARHEAFRTSPSDGNTFVRATRIANAVREFIIDSLTIDDVVLYVEGPAYMSKGTAQVDAGYLMARMDLIAESLGIAIHVVPPASVKKFATGRGNTGKHDMVLPVFERWGIKFEDDRGRDKLHAYCLHRYGEAVATGELDHKAPKARGQGKDAKKSQRKAAKTRNGGGINDLFPNAGAPA